MSEQPSLWSKATAGQLWALSMAAFWGTTLLITFIDFADARWLNIPWPSGPDLFPNMALSYPLAFLQLFAAGILLAAGAKFFSSRKTVASGVLATLIVVGTGTACFAAYVLFGLWYQFDLMGRSV